MSEHSLPMDCLYTPGGWSLLAGPSVWFFVDRAPTDLPEAWWASVAAGAGVDDLLGLLVDEGLRSVGAFALVGPDDASLVGALRGPVTLTVAEGDAETTYDGEGTRTWARHDLAAAEVRISPKSSADTGPWFPLIGGVVAAGGVALGDGLGSWAGPLAVADEEPVGSEQDLEPVAPGGNSVSMPGQLSTTATFPLEDDNVEVASEDDPAEESPAVVAGAPESTDGLPTFDHLFGATQRPSAIALPDSSDRTLLPEEMPGGPGAASISEGHPTDGVVPPIAVDPAPVDLARVAPAPAAVGGPGLIDALPWESHGTPTPVDPPRPLVLSESPQMPSLPAVPTEVPAPLAPAEESVDLTVNRAALLEAAAAASGPAVHAVRCSSDHLNPPFAHLCRVCGASLEPQEAFTAPRPVLGRLELSTGDVVTLDRAVVMGRAPVARLDHGADRPHVVALASPENDISRTHLEVRLDGWHVLIVDLESTNGTVVTAPGQPPVRLRANDPTPIEPGTTVSLADEVSFVFEVDRGPA